MLHVDFEAMAYGMVSNGATSGANWYLYDVLADMVLLGPAFEYVVTGTPAYASNTFLLNDCTFTTQSVQRAVIFESTAASYPIEDITIHGGTIITTGAIANGASLAFFDSIWDVEVNGVVMSCGNAATTSAILFSIGSGFTVKNATVTGCGLGSANGSGGIGIYVVVGAGGTLTNLTATGNTVPGATAAAFDISNAGTANGVHIVGNNCNGSAKIVQSGLTATSMIASNTTANPIGALTPPTYTSGSATTNTFPYIVRVNVQGSTAIAINGTATGLLTGSFVLAPGETITPTGVAGSWTWSTFAT
jgi:hypothetical protein